MTKYLGTKIKVMWAGTPLPYVTAANYDERSDIGRVDVTHAESTAIEYLDDLQDTGQTELTVTGFIPSGGSSNLIHSIDTSTAAGSVDYLPEGNAVADMPWYYEGTNAKIVAKRLGGQFRVGQTYELVFRKNTGAFSYKVTT